VIQDIILAFGTLFPIINPVGTTFIFESMAKGLNDDQRLSMAKRSILVSTAVLLGFMFAGPYILDFFGVTIYAFRTAGGIYLARVAMGMLGQSMWKSPEQYSPSDGSAVVPIAIPLLAGPGGMTTVVALTATPSADVYVATSFALVATSLISFVLLRYSHTIVNVVGQNGSKIFERVFGLLLLVIAAQFFFAGVNGFLDAKGLV
jgi:multiple antibiotic resistance protein